MKYKSVGLAVFSLLILLAAASCASAPPPEEPAPPVEPAPPPVVVVPAGPDQAAVNALNAAAARAEAARKLVSELEGETFFPDEWQSADSLYSQAEQQRNNSTTQSVQDSTARYNRAADAMEALAEKTIAAAYAYAEEELTYVRDKAVAAGAQALIPDFLLDADNMVLGALEKYEAKDFYAAKDAALEAYTMYSALIAGIEAYKLRMELADYGLDIYDPVRIGLIDDILYSAADDYEAKNYESAKNKAEEALNSYNTTLRTAWETHSMKKRLDASAARQGALDVRANTAMKPEFDSAEAVYNRANTAFNAGRYNEAGLLYMECEAMFELAAAGALDKRLAAEEALRRANQRLVESDEIARRSEELVGGGVQ